MTEETGDSAVAAVAAVEEQQQQQQQQQPRTSQHLVAGTIAGCVSTALLYPLDLVKTRYQAFDGAASAPYATLSTAFRTIVKNEGFGALYQGLGASMLGSGLSWGGYFYVYELCKGFIRGAAGAQQLGPSHHLAAGMGAGTLLVFAFNPLWLVRTRLQLQRRGDVLPPGQRLYTGLVDALVTIVREEGPLALYKGTVPAILLSTQGALQFAAYEWLKAWVPRDLQCNAPVESLLMGGGSKIFASVVTYPYQVIKTRLQDRHKSRRRPTAGPTMRHATATAGPATGAPVYTGTVQCATLIWQREGLRGFFRGAVPAALRAAPASAVTFLVYEECMRVQREWAVS